MDTGQHWPKPNIDILANKYGYLDLLFFHGYSIVLNQISIVLYNVHIVIKRIAVKTRILILQSSSDHQVEGHTPILYLIKYHLLYVRCVVLKFVFRRGSQI